MADDDTPTTVDDLYAVDPDEFVAARKALVRRLREQGDRDAAEQAGAARKPPRSAWALNVTARTDAEVVGRFVATIRELGSALGGDGDPRAAMAQHRAATEDVLDAAERITGISGESWRSRMRGTLQAAATDEEVAADLSAGTLRDDAAPSGLGPLGLGGPDADVVSLTDRREERARRGPRRPQRATGGRAGSDAGDEGSTTAGGKRGTRKEAAAEQAGATDRRTAERERRERDAAARRRSRLEADLAERRSHADRLAARAERARRAAEEAETAADEARAEVAELERRLAEEDGASG